jgi:hypothetical protein
MPKLKFLYRLDTHYVDSENKKLKIGSPGACSTNFFQNVEQAPGTYFQFIHLSIYRIYQNIFFSNFSKNSRNAFFCFLFSHVYISPAI